MAKRPKMRRCRISFSDKFGGDVVLAFKQAVPTRFGSWRSLPLLEGGSAS